MSGNPERELPSMDKLRWQCRRGMLELDYALSDFLEQRYPALPTDQQALFVRMLDFEDQLLLDWLMGNVVPSDEAIGELVEMLQRKR
jgi:antitoxin CptB